jgi:hypothetical protein
VFPNDLALLPPFATWVHAKNASTINDGDTIYKDKIHMSMSPTFEVMSYNMLTIITFVFLVPKNI